MINNNNNNNKSNNNNNMIMTSSLYLSSCLKHSSIWNMAFSM